MRGVVWKIWFESIIDDERCCMECSLQVSDVEMDHLIISSVIITSLSAASFTTRMWADTQRDDRPAEYRWRNQKQKFRNFLPCPTQQSLADAHCSSAVQ